MKKIDKWLSKVICSQSKRKTKLFYCRIKQKIQRIIQQQMLKIMGKKGEKTSIFVMEQYLDNRQSQNMGVRTSACSWDNKDQSEGLKNSSDQQAFGKSKQFLNSEMSQCPLKTNKKSLTEKKKISSMNNNKVNRTDSCIPYQFENLFADIQIPSGFLPRRKTLMQHLKPKKQQRTQYVPEIKHTQHTQDISFFYSYKNHKDQRANASIKKIVYHSMTRPQTGISNYKTDKQQTFRSWEIESVQKTGTY